MMDLDNLIEEYKKSKPLDCGDRFLPDVEVIYKSKTFNINRITIVNAVNKPIEAKIWIYKAKEVIIVGQRIEVLIKGKKLKMVILNVRKFSVYIEMDLIHEMGFLKKTLKYQIFQKKRYSKILEEMLRTVGGRLYIRNIKLDQERPLVIQYNETNYNFFHRICNRIVCYYKCQWDGVVFITSENTKPPKVIKDVIEMDDIQSINYTNIELTSHNPENPVGDLSHKSKRITQDIKCNYSIINDKYTSLSEAKLLAQYEVNGAVDRYYILGMNEWVEPMDRIRYKNDVWNVLAVVHKLGEDEEGGKDSIVILGNGIPKPQYTDPVTRIERATVKNPQNSICAMDNNRIFCCLHFDKKTVIPVEFSHDFWTGSHSSRFLPRNGEEILVGFEYNNPDKPIFFKSLVNKEQPSDPKNLEECYMKFLGHNKTHINREKFNELRFINNYDKSKIFLNSSDIIELKAEDVIVNCKRFFVNCEDFMNVDAKNKINMETTSLTTKSNADTEMVNNNFKMKSNINTEFRNSNHTVNSKLAISLNAMNITSKASVNIKILGLMITIQSNTKTELKSLITKISSQVQMESTSLITKISGMIVKVESSILMQLKSKLIMQMMAAIRMSKIDAIDLYSGGLMIFSTATVIFGTTGIAPSGFFKVGCPFP